MNMPKPRLPHLRHEKNRHGHWRWYFRRDNGPRIRLPDVFGSDEFKTAYQAALAGERPQQPRKPGKGTLSWLASQYKESASWTALSKATRRQRDNILTRTLAIMGPEDCASITKGDIEATMEAKASTPAAAKNFLATMRGLFQWAKKFDHVDVDPTAEVTALRPKTDGFLAWSEEDIAKFEAKWPIGTRERLAFDLLLYTGLRRGDAVIAGRQHIKNGLLTIKTEKTGETVSIPVLPELAASIAAAPTGDLVFITGAGGAKMTKESFGNWFRDVCNKAGLKKRSAHGLRKAAANRLAESGATVSQLDAWFGWTGGKMASLYTRQANKVRLTREAAKLLPHPKSGAAKKKATN